MPPGIRLEKERRELDLRKRERDEQHLYLTTKLITDETFTQHQGFDLASFDDRNTAASDLPSYRIPKSQPFVEFRAAIAKEHGYQPQDVRLWVLVNRQNKTVRPDAPVSDQDPTLSAYRPSSPPIDFLLTFCLPHVAMETVRDKMASRQHDLKLYLEWTDPAMKVQVSFSFSG